MNIDDIKLLVTTADWSKVDYAARSEMLVEQVLQRLGDLPGKRILDLGCGSAPLAVELAERGYDVVGLDLYVERARHRMAARGVTFELVEQDMAEMDYEDEFDAVVNWDVAGLGLAQTDAANVAVMQRVQRALRPGGKLLIETYNRPYGVKHGVEGMPYDPESECIVGRICRRLPDGSDRTIHVAVRLLSVGQWQALLVAAGLEWLGFWSDLFGNAYTENGKMLWVRGRK
jgi:SAM-dependent methyltransferase